MCVHACIRGAGEKASPFIISLLLDLCLDLGPDLLQVHRRLGRLTFLLRHTLSTALFSNGKEQLGTDTAPSQHLGLALQWTDCG